MKLLKPAWVSHDERSLFCVDIHPDGLRFATGGQGQDRTGTIAVWNMAPLDSEVSEKDRSVPRQLCRMDDHLGCVNCLRWSHSGKHLASGSDDKLVMIWRQAKTAGSAPFGSSAPAVEGWRAVATLRGHAGDVIDLAWSPADVYLATCSVDNLLMVWDAARWGQPVATLKGHTGLVKGLDWDPIGKYLCSQSDDRSLRVWRTADWRSEAVVTEPYTSTSGTTAVLRCSWSPDGNYIVSAHAMNNGGPTALIVDRGSWQADKYFVGHRKAITCVRFSPTLYSSPSGGGGKSSAPYCLCALGSRDRGVSVWLTQATRPLVVVHDLFDDSVMDLSWHPGSRRLIACSKDGTVACLSFTVAELGRCMARSELTALREKLYGRSSLLGQKSTTPQLVESPLLLTARKAASEQQKSSTPTVAVEKTPTQQAQVTPPAARAAAGASVAAASHKQIECRTPDGKRRITPMFVSSQELEGGSNFSGERTFTSSTAASPSVMVEKRDQLLQPQVSEALPPEGAAGAAAEGDAAPETVSPCTPEAAPIAIKRRMERDPRLLPAAKRLRSSSPPPAAPAAAPAPSLPPQPAGAARPLVAPLVAVSRITATLASDGPEKPALTLEVENGATVAGPHLLKCLRGKQLLWRAVLSSPAVDVRAAAGRCLVWCRDCTLHVYSRGGRLLLPPLAMPGHVARVSVRDRHVLVVTSSAHVSTWDVAAERAGVRREPAGHLLEGGARLTGCTLTEGGDPVLVMSTGRAYFFNSALAAWLLLTDAAAPGATFSDVQPQLPAVPASGQPLAVLTAQVRRHGLPRSAALLNAADDARLSADAAATFLDSQVAAAVALRSPSEYALWLSALVRQLSSAGDERRLRLICEQLLGPAHSGAALSQWEGAVMGLDKRQLLKQLLSLLVSELSLQRLYTEMKDQLDCIELAV